MRRVLWLFVCLAMAAYLSPRLLQLERSTREASATPATSAPGRGPHETADVDVVEAIRVDIAATRWAAFQPKSVPQFVESEPYAPEDGDLEEKSVPLANVRLCVFTFAGEGLEGLEVTVLAGEQKRHWTSGSDADGCLNFMSLPAGPLIATIDDGTIVLEKSFVVEGGENDLYAIVDIAGLPAAPEDVDVDGYEEPQDDEYVESEGVVFSSESDEDAPNASRR